MSMFTIRGQGIFDSRDVAAYIAQQCIKNHISYNNTKIQKLLYCVYGVVLAVYEQQICDERPHAWPYGPVFPKVFDYIHKGWDISGYSMRLKHELSAEEKTAIDVVLDAFAGYSAGQLSSWSHEAGSPWSVVTQKEGTGWNVLLNNQDIATYFKNNVVTK